MLWAVLLFLLALLVLVIRLQVVILQRRRFQRLLRLVELCRSGASVVVRGIRDQRLALRGQLASILILGILSACKISSPGQ